MEKMFSNFSMKKLEEKEYESLDYFDYQTEIYLFLSLH